MFTQVNRPKETKLMVIVEQWKMDIEKHFFLSSGKSIEKKKTADNSNKYNRWENCLVLSTNNAFEHLP